MTRRSKPTLPDGKPTPRAKRRGGGAKSKIGDVQDPLIAGDAGKPGARVETNEAKVDEAGQLRRNKGEVDLLH